MNILNIPVIIALNFILLSGNVLSGLFPELSGPIFSFGSNISSIEISGLLLNNAANLDYINGDFESAIARYEKALAIITVDQKAKETVYYNMGNSYFRQGQITLFDNTTTFFPLKNDMEVDSNKIIKTVGLWKNSISAYESAILIDQNDEIAKQNLEFVKEQLAYLLSSMGEGGDTSDPDGGEEEPENEDEPTDDDLERIDTQDKNGQENSDKGRDSSGNNDWNYKGPNW